MADVEPYGIMPYSEINDLKKQIKKLDSKDNVDSSELLKSVTNLTKNMDGMLQLFKTAAEEMKLEEQEERVVSQQIKPLLEKVDEIIEQNKIIAEGMVALSDLVKERIPSKDESVEEARINPVLEQTSRLGNSAPPFPQRSRNIPPPPSVGLNEFDSSFDDNSLDYSPPPMDNPSYSAPQQQDTAEEDNFSTYSPTAPSNVPPSFDNDDSGSDPTIGGKFPPPRMNAPPRSNLSQPIRPKGRDLSSIGGPPPGQPPNNNMPPPPNQQGPPPSQPNTEPNQMPSGPQDLSDMSAPDQDTTLPPPPKAKKGLFGF